MRVARSRGLLPVIATAYAGCAQVLGIDETSSNAVSIEIQLQRVSVGAAVVTAPLEIATPPAFLVQDSAEPSGVRRVPAALVEPGRWAAPLKTVAGMTFTPAGKPPLVVMFPDFSGPAITANYLVYEHPNPEPAPPPPANVAFNVTLPSPYKNGENLAVVVPGAWACYSIAQPPAIGATSLNPPPVPYSNFSNCLGGSLGKFTSQDSFAIMRYENSALTGQFVAPPLDQSTGTTMITGAMAPVTASTNFSVSLSAATVASRFTSQVPPPTTAAVQTWRIEASPGHAFGLPTGITLASGTFTATDTAINGVFANPFPPQWRATLSYVALATRAFSIGGAPAVMETQLQSIVEAGPGLTLDLPAGLPTMTAVNGVPLSSDGMTVALDVTKQVSVDLTTDRTQNTLYEVTLFEIAVVGNQVIETPIVVVSGLTPRLPLPPRSMQTGHTYNLRIRTVAGGYTNAAAGDLQAFALPVSYGYQEGAVFTVIPAT